MFAKNRTLAIRVGQYQSSDIKEASFEYGYIKGDAYKPGGTCAGSGKITFTSIITTFNKLDKIYPEIGLLVDGTYEWVKMGEYFINDIEIDRNRNTTTLDLMDGMFKLNHEYVTDLTFPAEIRQVVKEICLKAGVELANENMDIASMNYAIETKPKENKMTFRDVLSLATQMLGMSCFFNREGKLEIKELTDSGIVITADNYFLHGLTRSEVEYQIAGITCKKDKEGLTVGTRTGRSLEIENPFMTQSILDNLYHKIKDIRYYPFNLNFQGHLLLDVGQWVTIKTNKGETFKSPVLSQSFSFKGGLRSRISADSKAGNDAQYSYAGTITKKIEQFSEFEKQLQNQIEEADRGFDAKTDQIKQDFSDQIKLIEAKAEENKRALSDEIDRRFHDFSPAGFEEAKAKAEEALRKVGAGYELADEAKHIADQNSVIFAGLVDKFNKQEDKLGDTITDLKRYAREESASQARAVREDVTRDFVGKSTFQENVQGVERRLESLSLGTSGNLLKNSNNGFYNQKNKRYRLVETLQANQTYTLVTKYWHGEKSAGHTFLDGIGNWRHLTYNRAIDAWMVQFTPTQEIPAGTEITLSSHPADAKGNMNWATLVRGVIPLIHWQPAKGDVEEGVTQKLAEYKETVDGRFATISSQVNGKVNQSDFQRVKETSQLYERILGSAESDVSNNVSRMVMSSQIFQTEVGKFLTDDINLVYDPTNLSKWAKKQAEANVIEVQAGTKLLRITSTGKSQAVYNGFALPLNTSTFTNGEKLSYRIEAWVDVLPDGPLGIELWNDNSVIASDRVTFNKTGIQIITGTMTVNKTVTKTREFPLEIWLMKNGQVAIGQVSLIRGDKPPKKFNDNTSTQDVVTQTQVSQLHDSYAIQTLTGPGAISSQINLNSNNILIEAAKIRLKGRTLLDEITAIDGYFKRLFVGDARIGTLNTDIIRSNSIAADKLIFDTALAKKLVASDVFTDTLAAKTAFINKLRSVVVSATLLEGYKGKIGGFQFGTHDKDPTTFWITGSNSFRVGMSDGGWRVKQTALWVNWGNNWDKPGNYAWFVNNDGEMHCYNKAQFWNVPRVHGNLEVTGDIFYFIDKEKNKVGYWVHSPSYKRLEESNGYIYLYRQAGGYSWIPLNKEISDRRYKTNIQDSPVSALDVIDKLKTYSYRKEYDDKVEDISCGIMAQDVQKYAPEAFYENPDGAYSYRAFELVPYLIKAIQELNQKVERLEKTT
ncbi:hypothetical protein HMPREF1124_0609 [Streptococcus infantis X]|uniref:Peptidase S74 domain-containing protein n=1 Tax=Streptococcus infantis X TaxID=997830 RepID=F9PCG5_9STRE|nr:hypothetical protein HMPREF1124_0609 [Streptococcus infantis X]